MKLDCFFFTSRSLGESSEDAVRGGHHLHALLVATLRHFYPNQIGKREDRRMGRLSAGLRDSDGAVARLFELLHQPNPVRVFQ